MASRFKTPQMPLLGLPHLQANWRAMLIIVTIFAVILLPVWGSIVARIQSSTFPYPGLEMNFSGLAIDRLDSVPTIRNLNVTVTFQDLYSYGGAILLKVSITIRDTTTSVVEKYIDIDTRQEYVALASATGSAVVPAAVYTVLWLPQEASPGDIVGVNSFIGEVQAPVMKDSFNRDLPFGMGYPVRTAEGSFYYTLDTRVLQLYESNVAISNAPGAASPCSPSLYPLRSCPLRSITLMTYNDVASRGTMQGLLGSLAVLAAVLIVFGLHRDIDRRRKSRIEGLRNRIRSLSDVLEDQYLLGVISRETYMRRQVVLRRLASDIELEAQTRPNQEEGEPSTGDDEFFSAP